MKFVSWCFTAAALLLIAGRGAELGDPAAELKIATWVKGESVAMSADPKNIYVVEFWATWCPPCRTSIPHLTEMQKHFKDKNVTIIGITDENQAVVSPFVKSMGAKMDYPVAIDEDGETAKGYMQAYGVNGIPHAFIVREKKVIWHGHPMDGLDKTLEDVIAGKYDVAKAKAKMKAETLTGKFREAVAEGDDATADRIAQEIQAAIKDNTLQIGSFNPAAEKKMIRSTVLKNQYRTAVFRGQDEQAEEFGKKLLEADPQADLKALRTEALVRKDVMTYFGAVTGKAGTGADAKKIGAEIAEKVKGQSELGNNIAWSILTDEEIKDRDIPLALRIAKQAVDDSQSKSAHILDTYARALFDSGKKEDAVKAQEQAIAVASDEEKEALQKTLKAYKAGQLPSE
jgi:thiol-disulfide isomerase/thioredoxin